MVTESAPPLDGATDMPTLAAAVGAGVAVADTIVGVPACSAPATGDASSLMAVRASDTEVGVVEGRAVGVATGGGYKTGSAALQGGGSSCDVVLRRLVRRVV